MKLKDYLESQNLTVAQGAREAGYAHETFRKWANGQRRPRDAEDVRKILEWSKGTVTAADWYSVSTQAA